MELTFKIEVTPDKLAAIMAVLNDEKQGKLPFMTSEAKPSPVAVLTDAPEVFNTPAAFIGTKPTEQFMGMNEVAAALPPLPEPPALAPEVPFNVAPTAKTEAAKTIDDVRELVMQVIPAKRISMVQEMLDTFKVGKLSDLSGEMIPAAYEMAKQYFQTNG